KWHLDGGPRMPGYVPPGPRRQGFEFWAANECSHRHFDTQYFRDAAVPIPIKRFEVDAWTDLGLEFLEASRKDDRPFFLMISLGPPHDPYGAPDEYMKMYDPDKLTLRPNWKQAERVPGRKELAAYYAAITSVDHHFGRLLKTLDEFGMAEDTIVLFASDHGDMLGSQGLRLKRKPWEESILVPGILRYPRKVRPGRSSDALFSHIDLPPTLLSLCGAPVPSAMQGADLSAHILGGSGQPPDSAFFQIFGPFQGGGVTEGWRGVRTGRYMYARHQSKPWVLYDLQKDPYELENLINDPAAASILQDMDKRLQAWMNQTGDSWSFNWTHPVEDNGRLYRHLTFCSVHEYLAWAKEHEKESLR
ncbi:MAG: sulfatase-like hydrolase/transferase, partial [Gemmatimonadetes bacterium]|nr:sulfatase-like hydrolase/transferase [Gemmatimonadota bacterium]